MAPLRGVFVTGTDTGVGKTRVSEWLIHSLRAHGETVQGMKPVASGCERTPEGLRNADALTLRVASTAPVEYELHNPYAFEPPIAPHLAAVEAGVTIDFDRIAERARRLAGAGFLVVEGAGGWLVPLGDGRTMGDLCARLGLPVVLVVGLRLGCINHALLTAAAISAGGQRLAGWIGNRIDPDCARVDDILATLRADIASPCLGVLDHGPQGARPDTPRPDLKILTDAVG